MLVSMQERIALHLQSCITRGEVPDWMTTGRTVLLLKDKSRGNKVSNYKPITCSPLIWKLITGIAADEIYNHLGENHLLTEEQKLCCRNSRGTKDQLLTLIWEGGACVCVILPPVGFPLITQKTVKAVTLEYLSVQ